MKKCESSQECRAEWDGTRMRTVSFHSAALRSAEDGQSADAHRRGWLRCQEARPRFLVDPVEAALCMSGVDAIERVSVGASLSMSSRKPFMHVSAHLYYVSNYFKCVQIHERIWWGVFCKKHPSCFFSVDADFDRLLAFEQCRVGTPIPSQKWQVLASPQT